MSMKVAISVFVCVFVAIAQCAPQFDYQYDQQNQPQQQAKKFTVLDSRFHQDPNLEYNFELVLCSVADKAGY